MKLKFISFILIILLLNSQPINVMPQFFSSINREKIHFQWIKSFGTNSRVSPIIAFDLLITPLGHALLFTTPISSTTIFTQILIYKIYEDGELSPIKSFSVKNIFPSDDLIIEGFDKDGFLYILGYQTWGYRIGNRSYIYLIKMGSDGDIIYEKKIVFRNVTVPIDGVVDKNGYSYTLLDIDDKLYLVKLDPMGEILFKKEILENYDTQVAYIEVDGLSNVYIAYTKYVEDGSFKSYILKIDSEGNIEYLKNILSDSNALIKLFGVDDFGNIYFLIEEYSLIGNINYLIKLKSDGSEVYKAKLPFSPIKMVYGEENYVYLLEIVDGGVDLYKVGPYGNILEQKEIDLGFVESVNIENVFVKIFGSESLLIALNVVYKSIEFVQVIKVSKELEKIWKKDLKGFSEESIWDIEMDRNGNAYFGVDFKSEGKQSINLYKLNKFGKMTLFKEIKNGYDFEIEVESSGEIYLKYRLNEPGNYIIEKISSSGKILWSKNIKESFAINKLGVNGLAINEHGDAAFFIPLFEITLCGINSGFRVISFNNLGVITLDKTIMENEMNSILVPKSICFCGEYIYLLATRIKFSLKNDIKLVYSILIYKFSSTSGSLIKNVTIGEGMGVDLDVDDSGVIWVIGYSLNDEESKILIYNVDKDLRILSNDSIVYGYDIVIPIDLEIFGENIYIGGTYVEDGLRKIFWNSDGFLLKLSKDLSKNIFSTFDKGGQEAIKKIAATKDFVFIGGYYENGVGNIDAFVGYINAASLEIYKTHILGIFLAMVSVLVFTVALKRKIFGE